jgi:hypothetical protein
VPKNTVTFSTLNYFDRQLSVVADKISTKMKGRVASLQTEYLERYEKAIFLLEMQG